MLSKTHTGPPHQHPKRATVHTHHTHPHVPSAPSWVKRLLATTALVQTQAGSGGSPVPTNTKGEREVKTPSPALVAPERGLNPSSGGPVATQTQHSQCRPLCTKVEVKSRCGIQDGFQLFFFPPPYLSPSPEPLTKQKPLGTNISCREGSSRGRQQSFPWPQKPPASPKALGLWGGGGLWCFCS